VVDILKEVIYLFIYSYGGYVDSVFHTFNLLFSSTFDFQMLKMKQYLSTINSGRSLLVDQRFCSKNGEIF